MRSVKDDVNTRVYIRWRDRVWSPSLVRVENQVRARVGNRVGNRAWNQVWLPVRNEVEDHA